MTFFASLRTALTKFTTKFSKNGSKKQQMSKMFLNMEKIGNQMETLALKLGKNSSNILSSSMRILHSYTDRNIYYEYSEIKISLFRVSGKIRKIVKNLSSLDSDRPDIFDQCRLIYSKCLEIQMDSKTFDNVPELFNPKSVFDFMNLFSALDIFKISLNNFETCQDVVCLVDMELISFDINPSLTRTVLDELNHYQQVSKLVNESIEPESIDIIDAIKDLVKESHPEDGNYVAPIEPCAYSAIVGPSFSGKTQFAFTMARRNPVIYLNFSTSSNMQPIYQVFLRMSLFFVDLLQKDLRLVSEGTLKIDSDSLLKIYNRVPLYSAGFISKLIELSTRVPHKTDWMTFYTSLSKASFTKKSIQDLQNDICYFKSQNMKFKIPILYIDELIISRSLEIRLIRNIARCVAMPCVMASTNSKVNNLIVNLSNESSYWNKSVWVQVARKLANAKITTIFKTTVVNKNIKFDYFLNRRGKFDSRKLLKYFAISFDNNSLETFERMIFIMMRQCQTSISGVTFYSFDFLIQALKLQANSILDCSKIWNHICLNRFLTFEFRKPTAFKRDGPFYSLRAFSTTSATITSETEDTRSVDFGQRITFAECSINEHFYYFGYPEERNILKFKYDGTNLVDTNGTYYVKSYFPPFQDDIFTHLAIWYKLKSNTSVGSVVSAYKRVLLDITPNINSMSNDFRSQENVAYWSIAHSTHQNFNGNTEGALFFTNVVKNFQSFDPNVKAVETAGTDSIPLGLVSIKSLSVPTSLQNFLEKIKVPYLLPSKLPNLEFGGDMVNFEDFFEGFCNFGVCSRCTNQMGLDVCFDLFKDGEMRVGYVECKYTKLHKTTSEVLKYVQRAGEKRSPLTFYMSYELNSDLKEHHSLQKHVQTCDLRQSTIDTLNSDFNTNIYCVYYESEKTLSMVALREFDDPDSVFIIVETNFQAPKV